MHKLLSQHACRMLPIAVPFSREGQSSEGQDDDLGCRQNDGDPVTSVPALRSLT